MKRSKGGGNEIKLSPFWIQLCTLNPCEAKRLGLKQPGWVKHFPAGASWRWQPHYPTPQMHGWEAEGKPDPLPTESPVVRVPSKSPNANLTNNPLKLWDMMSMQGLSQTLSPIRK